MKIAGIIAEYNPFHNGHKFHLEQVKKITGADYVIVVMSGDFTQRGTPAIIDKYSRAKMAVACGADLVLEIPAYYACGSAEYFAEGAIDLLDKLGICDSICSILPTHEPHHPCHCHPPRPNLVTVLRPRLLLRLLVALLARRRNQKR